MLILFHSYILFQDVSQANEQQEFAIAMSNISLNQFVTTDLLIQKPINRFAMQIDELVSLRKVH